MSETSTNGSVYTPVNRVGTRRREHDTGVPDGDAAPMTNGHNGEDATTNAAGAEQAKEGRDARGRFGRGNPGGPGNPFARRVAQLRRTLCATVTDDDIAAVAKALVAQARAGDVAAARLLLSYTIGQPAPAVDPDTLDLAEWDIYRRTPVNMDEVNQFVAGMPAAFACKMANVLTPYLNDRAAQAVSAELRKDDVGTAAATAGAEAVCEQVDGHEEPAAPSTNGANGGRAIGGRPAARKRDRAAKPAAEAAASRHAAPPRTGRARANAPSTNGENGHCGVPRAPVRPAIKRGRSKAGAAPTVGDSGSGMHISLSDCCASNATEPRTK